MPHIDIPEGMPGIRGLMAFRPETARPLNMLAEVLLQGPSTLTKGERELIAAYVSTLNRCTFCASSHAAIAQHHLGDASLVQEAIEDPATDSLTPKMKALMRIAARVQEGGRRVTADDVAGARAEGATDVEIHDTVLIAAAFCMFNRYVDGLDTWAPEDSAVYDRIGAYRAEHGYLAPNNPLS